MTLAVEVVSPEAILFSGEAEMVVARTLGGGDIRRQDMPFVSNRMDFVRLGGGAMYELPKNFSVQLGAAQVLSGRNVGQSTTFTTGLMYALHL